MPRPWQTLCSRHTTETNESHEYRGLYERHSTNDTEFAHRRLGGNSGTGGGTRREQQPRHGDFNGDGFADLAVGVPGEDTPAGTGNSGAVNIIYGSANGLTGDGSVPTPRFFSQNAVGVPGDGSEPNDYFGAALAAGDFNGDRFSDLAIGQ